MPQPGNSSMTRRELLAQTSSAAVCGLLATGSRAIAAEPEAKSKTDPAMLQVVDTHQHLWDLKRFRLPWTAGNPAMARNYSIEDYLAATAGIPIVKSVYLEVDVVPEDQQAEADYVVDLCRHGTGPLAAAVISGRPAQDDFRAYIAPYRDHAYVRGVRQVLHGPSTPQGYCLEKQFVAGIQYLGELGLSFDICIRPGELADAAKLVDACPGTAFILDHCGNADLKVKDQSAWRRDMAAVAQRKNVVVKVSGIIASATPGKWKVDDLAPVVNHTLDTFGPERVMFGGDWPVCNLGANYRAWYDALREIARSRSDSEQRRLFHDNAIKHYRLT